MTTLAPEWIDQLESLTADLKAWASHMGPQEARYLVDTYYEMQEHRKRTANQVRALAEAGERPLLADWIEKQTQTLENNIKRLMQGYAEGNAVGQWSLSVRGVGPVIAGGLLAHIDVMKAPTVGHIWRFAGLDPTLVWNKGEKRPYNAKLKVLCWKVGDSFVKVSNHPEAVYGKVYRERKALEVERNERGDFADQAKATMEAKRITDKATKERYESGRLPDGRIDLRARRHAVKLFLAHWHHVAYESAFGAPPPKPYVIEHLGHAHHLAPPNWPMA